ncbi:MAG: AAA family ATPase [Planctomycetales bacterium]|nr:AAA family ATPase [Planctomycetales bacterium]
MKITDVQIDGFGVWSGLAIEDLSQEVTVFYGPNEAGKTTLMQFMRTVLYGLSDERRTRYLPPVYGGAPGGLLRMGEDDAMFTVRRRLPEDDDDHSHGHVDVIGHDGRVLGRAQLEALLSGIDESTFNNVFAVGLRELQELNTLNDTDAADQLYKLTTGLDRVSLVDVMRELTASRRRLLGTGENQLSQLGRLMTQRDRLRAEIDDLAQRGQRWAQLSAQTVRLKAEVTEHEEQMRSVERDAKLIETAIVAREPWLERRRVNQKIDELGNIPKLPPDITRQVEDVNQRMVKRREQMGVLRRQLQTIRDEGKAQPINRLLWAAKTRIEAVCEHGPWIASLEDQIRRFEPEVAALEAELHSKYEESGLPSGVKYSELPDLSRRSLNMLRGPAKRIYMEERRLKQIRNEKATVQREANEISKQLVSSLSDLGHEDLDSAMEAVGERLNDLRRRMKLQERLEKMERHRRELEDDHEELLEAQVLPMQSIGILAIPFIISCTCLMSLVLWGIDSAGGIVLLVLGMCGLIGTMLLKLWMERNAREELEECEHQLEVLGEQIQKSKEERDDLERRMPLGGGPLEVRLKAAEDELARLERLLPMEAERKAAMQRDEAGDMRTEKAAAALETANERWRQALEEAGLPETLNTRQVRELSRGFERIAEVQSRLDNRREELRQRKSDLAAITSRINQLVSETGLQVKAAEPQGRLRELAAAVAGQQQMVERRRVLKKQFTDLRRGASRCRRVLDRLEHRRSTLLASVGAGDENDLRALVERVKKYEGLVEDRHTAERQITASIGPHFRQEDVLRQLEDHPHHELERRHEKLEQDLRERQEALTQLHQRRGELNQEMKALAEDRRLDQARLELTVVDEQIAEATQRWRVLAVTELILESVRAVYEKERQPATLQKASEYLTALTNGHYRRVWTPLGSDRLRVDNHEGESLPVEVLSRGTREAVFFSLRLALVASYAKRGAALPLVLDDILVNFDASRATLAARVLRDFALEGHQIMMFTCHEHIVKLFMQTRAEIRTLPDRHNMNGERYHVAWEEPEPIVEEEPVAEEEVFEEPVPEEPVIEEPVAEEPIEPVPAAPPAPIAFAAVIDELDDDWPEEAPIEAAEPEPVVPVADIEDDVAPPPPTPVATAADIEDQWPDEEQLAPRVAEPWDEIDEFEDLYEEIEVESPPEEREPAPVFAEQRQEESDPDRLFTWEPAPRWSDLWQDEDAA